MDANFENSLAIYVNRSELDLMADSLEKECFELVGSPTAVFNKKAMHLIRRILEQFKKQVKDESQCDSLQAAALFVHALHLNFEPYNDICKKVTKEIQNLIKMLGKAIESTDFVKNNISYLVSFLTVTYDHLPLFLKSINRRLIIAFEDWLKSTIYIQINDKQAEVVDLLFQAKQSTIEFNYEAELQQLIDEIPKIMWNVRPVELRSNRDKKDLVYGNFASADEASRQLRLVKLQIVSFLSNQFKKVELDCNHLLASIQAIFIKDSGPDSNTDDNSLWYRLLVHENNDSYLQIISAFYSSFSTYLGRQLNTIKRSFNTILKSTLFFEFHESYLSYLTFISSFVDSFGLLASETIETTIEQFYYTFPDIYLAHIQSTDLTNNAQLSTALSKKGRKANLLSMAKDENLIGRFIKFSPRQLSLISRKMIESIILISYDQTGSNNKFRNY